MGPRIGLRKVVEAYCRPEGRAVNRPGVQLQMKECGRFRDALMPRFSFGVALKSGTDV